MLNTGGKTSVRPLGRKSPTMTARALPTGGISSIARNFPKVTTVVFKHPSAANSKLQ